MVFKHRVLKRIFGLTKDETVGGLRKVHNEELHNVCSLPCIIRMMASWRTRWAGHVERILEKKNTCKIESSGEFLLTW
jgi:hypothetical protein